MYKIKPSILESYRIFKLEIFEKSLEDFIKGVKGERERSPEMDFGSKVHKYLEDFTEFDFMPEELEQLSEIKSQMPLGVAEVKSNYNLNGVNFSFVIDLLSGIEVHEYKIGNFWGVDSYDNSLQWKIYLLATGAKSATYHIISYNDVRPYKFKYHKPFTFYPYPEMESDVMFYVNDFIEFCKIHGLESYITKAN